MALFIFLSKKMSTYTTCALFIGLFATVCAKAVIEKDVGLLTPEQIEENLQVYLVPQP